MTTLEPVSVALKFGFLVVLYLFLLWVVRSAWRDLRRSRDAGVPAAAAVAPPPDATGLHRADENPLPAAEALAQGEPRLVVEHAPGHPSGIAYALSEGATLGRGEVEIRLEDPFASTRHARIEPQGAVVVIEDLGSTNGTFLNDEQLGGPQPLHGDSEFSYLHD